MQARNSESETPGADKTRSDTSPAPLYGHADRRADRIATLAGDVNAESGRTIFGITMPGLSAISVPR